QDAVAVALEVEADEVARPQHLAGEADDRDRARGVEDRPDRVRILVALRDLAHLAMSLPAMSPGPTADHPPLLMLVPKIARISAEPVPGVRGLVLMRPFRPVLRRGSRPRARPRGRRAGRRGSRAPPRAGSSRARSLPRPAPRRTAAGASSTRGG